MSKNIYNPVVYKIEKTGDIFKHALNTNFSQNIGYAKFSYGFHHFYHQSKDKMEQTEQFENKKKVYLVLNEFEDKIDEYESDLDHLSQKYLGLNQKNAILDLDFYKLWEMIVRFDLVDVKEKNFVSAHLSEGPGSFIQSTMLFRDKFCKGGISKKDKYHTINMHGELNKYTLPLDSNLSKEKRLVEHKTYPKEISGGSLMKGTGDLTNPKDINLFGGNFTKNKVHLITSNNGSKWENENIQEQQVFKLILGQIVTALKIQADKGHFVCKMYESFTPETANLICVLSQFYEHVFVTKPLMSRDSSSEKYIVCKNFKASKDNNKKIALLEKVLKDTLKFEKQFLINMFPSFEFGDKFKSSLIQFNNEIANNQFRMINEMITFIDEQNYRGDKYQTHRNKQITATEYWSNMFFMKDSDFDKMSKDINKMTMALADDNQSKVNNMAKKLA